MEPSKEIGRRHLQPSKVAHLMVSPLTGEHVESSQLRSFLKANWLGIVGVVVGVAGILYTVYMHRSPVHTAN